MDKQKQPVDRLRQVEFILAVLLVAVIVFALVLAAVMPHLTWQADIAACVRILGLDEAYCADYLRLIRE